MFNQATRQSWVQLNPLQFTSLGISQLQLPQVGFLSKIVIMVTMTFSVTATGGAVATPLTAPQLSPYQLIRRLILRTNEGAEVYNTSGEGNYIVQRGLRTAFDPRNPLASPASTNTANAIFQQAASYGNGGPYTITFPLFIPVAWEEALLAGLILMQNPTTRMTLEIQWGQANDCFSFAGDSALTNVTVTTAPMMEIFNVPADFQDYPDLSMVHVILEDTQSVTTTGDFLYRPPLGNIYLRVWQEFVNNNARMTPANFSRLSLNYAQTQTAYTITPAQQLFFQRLRNGGLDLMDGVFDWNFIYGSGILEMGNTRDVIDTSRLTDMSLITTVAPAVVLTNAQVRSIKEMLAPIAR